MQPDEIKRALAGWSTEPNAYIVAQLIRYSDGLKKAACGDLANVLLSAAAIIQKQLDGT